VVTVAFAALLAVVLLATPRTADAKQGVAQQLVFKSVRVAMDQGLGAYKAGNYALAVPPLKFAAQRGAFLARFLLAQIYADNATTYTNHPEAYRIYKSMADEFADIDPADDPKVPYVAHAMVQLADYVKHGLKTANVVANGELSEEYLHHAATFFNSIDAQFELARTYLQSEKQVVNTNLRLAMHWLLRLTKKKHAGGQALLADLLWHGRYVRKDGNRALGLITIAVENAPPGQRIWIEEIYQRIFCGTAGPRRRQSGTVVAKWRKQYGRSSLGAGKQVASTQRQPSVRRLCGDGVSVPDIRALRRGKHLPSNAAPAVLRSGAGALPAPRR
jgi:hypothetical protein